MVELDERYSRQVLIEEIGEAGQRALGEGSVLVVGCGALGSNLSSILVRAGVGLVRIVDPDVLHRHNLHRQVLFDEDDARARKPKARAAADKLRRINSDVRVDEHVLRVEPSNVEGLLEGIDVVVDGLDNFESRYLVNDACVKHGVPWVYGGVIATTGMTMTVVPGEGPCIRCLFPDPPPPGVLPTTDTEGVLNTAPATIACLQATEAFKLLIGDHSPAEGLLHADLWTGSFRRLQVNRDPDCTCCGRGIYEFLEA